MSKKSNTKYINLIPFTEKDLELLQKCKSIKKFINLILYEPAIHIYISEEPKDAKSYEIFLSYEMEDGDTAWICLNKLKDYGVDVEKLNSKE